MVQVAVAQITTPASAGSVSYTGGTALCSFTPKAAIFLATNLTADGYAAGAGLGLGLCGGTNSTDQFSASVAADDNVTTSNDGGATYDGAICLVNSAGSARTLEARVTAFLSDGLTMNWVTTPGSGRIVHVLLLGGSDLTNVAGGTFSYTTGTGSFSPISGLGWQPDTIITMMGGGSHPATGSGGRLTFGCATGASNEWAIAISGADADTMASFVQRKNQRSDCSLLQLGSNGAELARADLTSFDSGGVTFNKTTAPGSSTNVGYLALKTTGHAVAGVSNKPTGADGSTQDIAAGATPAGALLASFGLAATTAISNDMEVSFGVTDLTNEGAVWTETQDAASPIEANTSTISGKALRLSTGAATTNAEADASASGTDLRLTWSTNNAVASEIAYLIFQSGATNATVNASVVTLTASLPAPTVVAEQNATITPNALTATLTMPGPTVTAGTDAAVTPAALTAALTLAAPTVTAVQNATVTPAALVATIAPATPVITTTATVTTAAISAALAVAAPVIAASAGVAPNALLATVAVNAPAVEAVQNPTVTPATLSATFAVQAPQVSAGGSVTITPPVLTATLTVRDPSVAGAATVAPAAVSLAAAPVAPTVGVAVAPAPLAVAVSLVAPVISAGATVTPAALTATFSTAAPTVSAGGSATVQPARVAATLALPAPAVAADALVTPATVSATFSLGAPTISTTQSTTVTPAAVSATFSLPAPAVSTGQSVTVTPDAVSAAFSVPTAAASVGATPEPAALAATFSVAAPTVEAVQNPVVAVGALALVLALPTPTVEAVIRQFIGTVRVDTVAAYSVRVGDVRVGGVTVGESSVGGVLVGTAP